MKRGIVYTILLLTLFTSCGMVFKQGIDNAVTSFVNVIFADSCDIQLLNNIVDFRKNNKIFPPDTWIKGKMQMQSKECQSTYDSINIISYGSDSASLFLIKQFTNRDAKPSIMRKFYRMRFVNDTLTYITPNFITSKDNY